MTSSAPLRSLLRKIPRFSALPGPELDGIIRQMHCKRYEPGQVLWRTGSQLDFLTILQSGELSLEYRLDGALMRTLRLQAGDYVLPRDLRDNDHRLTILARAVTPALVYILKNGQPASPPVRAALPIRGASWQRYWPVFVILLTLFITRNDLSRIASAAFFLSAQARQPVSDYRESLGWLRYAKAVDPGAVFAHNQEGVLWFRQDDLQDARAAFSKALEIEQTNAPALNNLAVVYFKSGQPRQGMELQQKAVLNSPDSAEVRYNQGLSLLEQNQPARALREFKEAAYINPTWALPYIQQGYIHLQLRADAQAEQAARQAIQLDGVQKSAHLILAIALYNQDKNPQALKAVEHALRIDPGDPVASFYKARILSNLGEYENAVLTLNTMRRAATDPQQISRITAELEALRRSRQGLPTGAR